MHENKTPMVASKTRHAEQSESSILPNFDRGLSFVIANRIVTTSAFHNAMLGGNSNAKFGAAPKFTAIVGTPSKSRDAISSYDAFTEPDPESDGRVFVATQEHSSA
jgi:hypothetical protein